MLNHHQHQQQQQQGPSSMSLSPPSMTSHTGFGNHFGNQTAPIVAQLSPIAQPYTADVCQYGPIYNAYNAHSGGGPCVKVRAGNAAPYGRTAYPPPTYHHPHQNHFPNAAFYPRTVQNPYDYSPRWSFHSFITYALIGFIGPAVIVIQILILIINLYHHQQGLQIL